MNYKNLIYSEHALTQMFSRNIYFNDVETTLKEGETIEEYPDDNPYPSKLILGFIRHYTD